jgi:hypothetical protein
MKILIPCKNEKDFAELSEQFKGVRDVTIRIEEGEKILGERYSGVLITHEFSVEEWNQVLLPLIVVPMDIMEKIKKLETDEVKKKIMGD